MLCFSRKPDASPSRPSNRIVGVVTFNILALCKVKGLTEGKAVEARSRPRDYSLEMFIDALFESLPFRC